MELQEILDIFLTKDNFTILTHKSPDGDTLGSGFALCFFLRSLGKHANVLNSDKLPQRYAFLFEGYEPQEFKEEYVVAVDIADPNLIGSNLPQYQQEGVIDLCIDHHISNKGFAKQTYVDGKASAAAMIIYEILKLSGKPISDHIAKCLYTGISTDTGCFKYENTTPKTHIIAAELKACFIRFFHVGQYIAGFGRLAHEHRQHACCHRVERTCVTEAFYPQHAAKFCDDVKGRPALRFVHRQYACKIFVVCHIT